MAKIGEADVRRGAPVWLSFGDEAISMPDHAHWSTYDMNLEGARFNALAKLVANPAFDAALAWCVVTDLESLAHSKGWADEDSFSFLMNSPEPDADTEEANLRLAARQQHDEDSDGEYSNCMAKSARLLIAAAASPDAMDLARLVEDRMQSAREAGATRYRTASPARIPQPVQVDQGLSVPGP